jgi:polysaccharide biosynthesis/export protein
MHKLYRQNRHGFGLLLLFTIYILINSCVPIKKSVYYNDIPDSLAKPLVITQYKYEDPKIESNDILAITVQTAAQVVGNMPITSNAVGMFNPLNGFLVDKNGYVEIALIGFVKVAGLTTAEARELIKQKAKEMYNDPVVNVRIANFDIYVLGDVTKPGVINSTNEKISIMDALAMAGDMNITAKRGNVLLTRSIGDDKIFVRLNLNSSEVFRSPYFYLKQRDQIYVEPNRNKIQSSDNTLIRNLGILSSLLSIAELIVLFTHFK